MCHKYGKRLVLTPINQQELDMWNGLNNLLGPNLGLKTFRFWHKWFVKE